MGTDSEIRQIFISWSGERSRDFAILLKGWLTGLIQAATPWMSEEDIRKGSDWNRSIKNALERSYAGVICLTQANLNSLWMSYEAGYLSSTISDELRVVPFLIDVPSSDLPSVYANLQYVSVTRDDVWKMVQALNEYRGAKLVDEARLKLAFESAYSSFEREAKSIVEKEYRTESTPIAEHSGVDVEKALTEILDSVRSLVRDEDRVENPRSFATGGIMGIRRFREGDRVTHDVYGHGTVVTVYNFDYPEPGERITIEFDEEGLIEFDPIETGNALRFLPTNYGDRSDTDGDEESFSVPF